MSLILLLCIVRYFFIPASNEPGGHTGMSIWRLPRGARCAGDTYLVPTEAERRPDILMLASRDQASPESRDESR